MNKLFFQISSILLSILLFSSCTQILNIKRHNPSEVAQVWANQMVSLSVEQAFSGVNEIYIKYKAFLKDSNLPKDFYVKASWNKKEYQQSNLARQMIVPLTIMEKEQWENSCKDLEKVVFLSSDQWKACRLKFALRVTPEEKNAGIVIRSGEEELILYYVDGAVQMEDLKNKPPEIKIVSILNEKKSAQMINDVLEEYLEEKNISPRKILATRELEEANNKLFIYFDLKENLMLSLKILPEDFEQQQKHLLKSGWKTADHLLLDSHVFGVAKRPISSAYRLFILSKNNAFDIFTSSINFLKKKSIPDYYQGPGMDLALFEKKLDKEIGKYSFDGSLKFLIGGDEFFPRLIESFIGAKESIQVRLFIFDNDDYGVKIADILKKKSNEGVEVKVLLDGIGQIMGEGKSPKNLPPGFVPPSSILEYLTTDSKVKVRLRPNAWFKADHTKTIVIDDNVCFSGGMNIGREYRYEWHDLMMEIEGPILREINREFKLAWAHSGVWGDLGYFWKQIFSVKGKKQEGKDHIRILYTKLNHPQIYKAQLLAIKEAKKYIYINNAYFSDNAILYELVRARKRGVDVRVILPVNGNHEIMNKSNIVTANIMFEQGIKVYFYPGMSHIKAGIYDGWLCAGSANFDKLSLVDNIELDFATSDKETVDHVKKVLFEKDMQKSKLMRKLFKKSWKDFLAEILAERL